MPVQDPRYLRLSVEKGPQITGDLLVLQGARVRPRGAEEVCTVTLLARARASPVLRGSKALQTPRRACLLSGL